jgi:hypothetical protein
VGRRRNRCVVGRSRGGAILGLCTIVLGEVYKIISAFTRGVWAYNNHALRCKIAEQ